MFFVSRNIILNVKNNNKKTEPVLIKVFNSTWFRFYIA